MNLTLPILNHLHNIKSKPVFSSHHFHSFLFVLNKSTDLEPTHFSTSHCLLGDSPPPLIPHCHPHFGHNCITFSVTSGCLCFSLSSVSLPAYMYSDHQNTCYTPHVTPLWIVNMFLCAAQHLSQHTYQM